MQSKIMTAVVCAAGLWLTGCMTEPASTEASAPDESTEAVVGQDVSTGVRCSDKTWVVNFFSDATLTTKVGTMSCACFQMQQLTGVVSNFPKLAFEITCDLN
jgi:hypothetical protein